MNPATSKTAKLLRKNLTREERRLWQQLRNGKMGGLKFRRQQAFDQYILDFFCAERRVAIELDGGQHGSHEQLAEDAERDSYLASQGVKTIRIWNRAVRENLQGVLEQIAMELGLKS